MFGVGPSELLVILVVALLVLGPKRLPELAHALGKGLAEFRKATSDLTSEFDSARNAFTEEASKAARDAAAERRVARAVRDDETKATQEATLVEESPVGRATPLSETVVAASAPEMSKTTNVPA